MEEKVAMLLECEASGSESNKVGSVIHVDVRSFVANLAESKREVVFRKQVECPKCRAMVGLEFAEDKRTGRAKTAIYVSKTPRTTTNEEAGFIRRLFGNSSNTTEPRHNIYGFDPPE